MAEPTRIRCECSSCDAVFCGDELDFEEELILDYGEEDFEADV